MRLLITALACLTNVSILCQDLEMYSAFEANASKEILELQKEIFTNHSDWDKYMVELHEIIDKTPENYTNSFEKDGNKFVKFWDREEYNQYKTILDENVEYLQNVYPLAHYLLAIILIERGDYENAYDILNRGLELERDQPYLLNEMAFMYSNIGSGSGDQEYLNLGIEFYNHAIISRDYNTPSQTARSLRGIGFILVELELYEDAKSYYEESLNFSDSQSARSEIELINNKINEGIEIVQGTSNIGHENWGENPYNLDYKSSLKYYLIQEAKLPSHIKESIPNKYVYIWSKASMCHVKGLDAFRKDDYFNYPLKEWNQEQIDFGCEQINSLLRGTHKDQPIEQDDEVCIDNLLLTFHFEPLEKETINNSSNVPIMKILFKHIMDDSEITLYFKLTL